MNIDSVLKSHGIGVGSGSNIKSIQRGVVDSGNITSSGFAINISKIDITKSIIRVTYRNNNTDMQDLIRGEITSETQIKLFNGKLSGTATGRSIHWEVIEFNNVRSLQKGTYTTLNPDFTDESISISSIDISKSVIFDSFSSTNSSASYYMQSKGAIILNNTTISIIKHDFNGLSTHHWQVIEFN